jgi:Na+/proline symporter
MSGIDWLVMCATLFSIVLYGMWKSRGTRNIDGYLRADRKLPWYHVGFSVMATQASAITFLAAPGQGFSDGMRFVQFYFGLPIAMVVLCITFIPIFHKLNVYTAYEYLEKRFDNKTRSLTALLFLFQRGLSTGITIYAPAMILSTILKTDITGMIVFTGIIVIIYTVYGGSKAVSYTQVLQMTIIFTGLFLATFLVVHLLPENVGFIDALRIAGQLNKLEAIDTHFDVNNRYNLWSGIIGGFFLHLSYFGTDQSQVGRYLTGESVAQSRLGLVMNGLIKIPMQFFILLIGVLIFTFYQFHATPVFFNEVEVNRIENSRYKEDFRRLEQNYKSVNLEKQKHVAALASAVVDKRPADIEKARSKALAAEKKSADIKKEVTALMEKNNILADTNDINFVFLIFVTQQFPVGVIGLLMAIIILAAMGSTASGLNSLASTSVVDFYKRLFRKSGSDKNYLAASRWFSIFWGVFCIGAAIFASKLGNLIEAVNILGSLFYGTILGIFLVAFYLRKINGTAVFCAALIAEAFIAYAWIVNLTAFLWLNVIGCLLVMTLAYLIQWMIDRGRPKISN